MRRDVLELREFYAAPLGGAAREMVARKVAEAWGDARRPRPAGAGLRDAVPGPLARRRAAGGRRHAGPAGRGGLAGSARATAPCWSTRTALPFPNALFDRVLAVHALEESDSPLALLREVGGCWRRPAG